MTQKSFQDYYPDVLAHCYGCGRLNEHGHQIKSYWDGDESVCYFLPKPYHISVPGFVYGGLLASLIDCHGTGTAAAAMYKANKEQDPNAEPNTRFLTASIHVDYLLRRKGLQVRQGVDNLRIFPYNEHAAQNWITTPGEPIG